MQLLNFVVTLLLCSGHLVAGRIKNKGWWKNAVIYQIYPRSFMDSNNDGIGDLRGVINKFDHFIESGIDAIWLSPIYASPMLDFGYDISDFRDVQPEYGTIEDLEELTSKAKQHGIKVIMDFVPNHTSDQHYWWKKSLNGSSKYRDYYVWREGKNRNTQPPNNWLSPFSGSAWTYDGFRKSWYYHAFGWFQPDLNFTNPEVREEMEQILKYWLRKGIDGFRIDSANFMYEVDSFPDEPKVNDNTISSEDYASLKHIYSTNDPRTFELIKSWKKVLDDWADRHNDDEKIILTEVYSDHANVTKLYKYGTSVPFNFNFIGNVTKNSKPSHYRDVINDWMASVPRDEVANWVMGNHDNNRVGSRFPGRADQMMMLEMILPGVAVTYNGEEIGMIDKDDISWADTIDPQACNTNPAVYQSKSRDPERTPFQWNGDENAGFSNASRTWLPVNDNYYSLNLAKQKQDSQSHYKLYQKLTKLKKSSRTLRRGRLVVVTAKDDTILAVMRQYPGETVMELINFLDDKSQDVNIRTTPRNIKAEIIVSSVGSNIEWGSIVRTSNVTLPAKASVVLRFKTRIIRGIE